MALVDEVVTELRDAQGFGFAVSEPRAYEIVNRAIKRVARRALSIQAVISLGTTVADQEDYELPANVIDLRRIKVGTVANYSRISLDVLWDLKDIDSDVTLAGRGGGVFAPQFSNDGATRSVSIYPAPDAGQAISGFAVLEPADDLEAGDSLPFSDPEPVVNMAASIAYKQVDENPESSAYYLNLANEGAEELRRQTISQVGSGPNRIRLVR